MNNAALEYLVDETMLLDSAHKALAMSPQDLRLNRWGSDKFSVIAGMYAFTTENIAGYFSDLPLEGAHVLSVGGSGDQIINSFLLGASEVDAFDINLLSGFFTELKLAALEEMNLVELKNFFFLEDPKDGTKLNPNALQHSCYETLRGKLSASALLFFDQAYQKYDFDGQKLRVNLFRNYCLDDRLMVVQFNPYLHDEHHFQNAKQKLNGKKIQWFNSSADHLCTLLGSRTYDLIILSNIADYAPNLGTFYETVLLPLQTHLRPLGTICAAYVFDVKKAFEPQARYHADIDNPFKRRAILGRAGLEYSEFHFESIIPEKKDAVILLQKKD